MARVVAALASDGTLRDVVILRQGSKGDQTRPGAEPAAVATSFRSADAPPGKKWLDRAGATALRRDMRAVVTSGTGRSLAAHAVPIAGKTGTAEVDGRRSHAWFVGFAPYDEPRIAFATIVENAGYGGRMAAPLAGELVSAAAARGLLQGTQK
jgi:peptidoglycan glycosyltransferase